MSIRTVNFKMFCNWKYVSMVLILRDNHRNIYFESSGIYIINKALLFSFLPSVQFLIAINEYFTWNTDLNYIDMKKYYEFMNFIIISLENNTL